MLLELPEIVASAGIHSVIHRMNKCCLITNRMSMVQTAVSFLSVLPYGRTNPILQLLGSYQNFSCSLSYANIDLLPGRKDAETNFWEQKTMPTVCLLKKYSVISLSLIVVDFSSNVFPVCFVSGS